MAVPARGASAASRRSRRRRLRFLAWLGLAGITQFTVAAVALHALTARPPWYMSEFANSRYWWLWVAGTYSFAVGGTALTLALRSLLPACAARTRGVRLLGLAGCGSVLLATFPVDRTPSEPTVVGVIHNVSAMSTFLLLAVAIVTLAPAFQADARWRRMARASVVLGLLVATSFVTYVVGNLEELSFVMPAQRVMVGLIAIWFVLLAVGVLRSPVPPAATRTRQVSAVRRSPRPRPQGRRHAPLAASRHAWAPGARSA